MFNFDDINRDANDDERIPTYEEFLEEAAKGIQQTPSFQLIRQGFKVFQYFISKENAFIEVLEEKGLWSEEDNAAWEEKTRRNIEQFEGRMAKGLIQAAASGNLRLPGTAEGVSISPDDALAMFSEFLTGDGNLSADSIRILLSFTGQDEEALKAAYEQRVAAAKISNNLRKSMRSIVEKFSRRASEGSHHSGDGQEDASPNGSASGESQDKEERRRRLEAYLDRVYTEGAPMPTLSELDRMISGELEIPDGQ